MRKLLTVLLVATSAVPASAAIVSYDSRSAFEAAAGTLATDDYNRAPATHLGYIYYPPSAATFAGYAVQGNELYLIRDYNNYGLAGSDSLYNATDGTVTFTFETATTAFGIDVGSYYAGTGFTVTVDGNSETGTTSSDPDQGLFFGLTSSTGFTTVSFTGSYLKFDNLAFGADSAAVPEPAMLGLFGLGAIGLGLARRRRV